MSDAVVVKPTSPVLAWGTVCGVVGLALGGFILSFQALRDLAVSSGIMPQLAFIWPLIVDGFIIVATSAAFALKRRGRRVTWYPWSALILFSAISVTGNASHAVNSPGITVPVWVATVVSSVPAVALLIASHLLVVMIAGKPRPRKKEMTASRADSSHHVRPVETQSQPTESGVSPQLRSVERSQQSSLPEKVARALASGRTITGALIAELEGVSERTGRRRMQELRETQPELFGDYAFAESETAS